MHREVSIVSNGYMYEVASWQGLLQHFVYLIGRGYYHYCIVTLPEKKRNRWQQIDQKIIAKYHTETDKFRRSRRKVNGLANFHYLRWDSVAVILHTEGKVDENILVDDKFLDARSVPVILRISKLSVFRIYRYGGRWTINLARETYQGIKAELIELALCRNVKLMVYTFDKLNGYPPWAGIIAQKRQLAQLLCKEAKKHQVFLSIAQLRITDKRKPVTVWSTNPTKTGLDL